MTAPYRLRPVEPEDREAVITLIGQVLEEHGDRLCLDQADRDLARLPNRYREAGGAFVVLENTEDATLVGCHGWLPVPDQTGCATLRRLYLDAGHRGGPAGTMLMNWALSAVEEAGYGQIAFWSDCRFDRAHRFFRRFGFLTRWETRTMDDAHEPYREFRFWQRLDAPCFPEQPPILETERLQLRPFTESDGPAVETLAGAWAVAETTLNLPHPYEPCMAAGWIATHRPNFDDRQGVVCAVTDRKTGQLVGTCGLGINRRGLYAELGYWIGEPFWRRGYATEASEALVRFGFETLQLQKITSRHLPRNPASGRVMQKLGMLPEGEVRHAVRKAFRFEDTVVYGLLHQDWLNARHRPDHD